MKSFLAATALSLAVIGSPLFAQAAPDAIKGVPPSNVSDRSELAAKYPGIEEGSLRPEDPKILCPFHRMLERAGLYDSSKRDQMPLTVSIIKIASYAHEFGCKVVGCGGVATAASGGQLTQGATTFGDVNVEALHKAFGLAHDCGLTFAKGGTTVSNEVRSKTLAALSSRATSEGHLTLQDLEAVKENICAAQRVQNNPVGKTEVRLIYAFLGGKSRGYIDYADVERFLHAELPKTIGEPEAFDSSF
ncbi:MAG: hypothetical protein H7249_13935 [Chitinophagaceae bacterium]|nr:hypothetical protein [Oligoflexus sp.]